MINRQELTQDIVNSLTTNEIASALRHREVITMLKLQDDESNKPVLTTLHTHTSSFINAITEKLDQRLHGDYSFGYMEKNLYTSKEEQGGFVEKFAPTAYAASQMFTDYPSIETLYLDVVAEQIYEDIIERRFEDGRTPAERG